MTRTKWNTLLIILLAIMVAYYIYYLAAQKNVGQDLLKHKKAVAMANINSSSANQSTTINVTYYTPDSQGQTLQSTTSSVQLPSGYAEYDLLKMLVTSYIAQDNNWIDPSTQVINLFVQNGTVYLNLSSGFTSKMDNAAHTQLIIDGLVDTIIANDSNISQVAFLINGQASSTISQNMNNQQFFKYDTTYISN